MKCVIYVAEMPQANKKWKILGSLMWVLYTEKKKLYLFINVLKKTF